MFKIKSVYYGSFIHSVELSKLEYLAKTAIGVDESGRIAFIDKNCSLDETIERRNLKDVSVVQSRDHSFFFPGLIDTHIHASQYPNVGIFGDSTLLDWLNKYTFPLESSFTDQERARQVYSRVVRRTLDHGTTTACYYATIHAKPTCILADEALRQVQRAFVGRVCMVDNSPDFYVHSEEESKVEEQKLIDYIEKIDPTHNLVTPIITPRFAPSCTAEMMKWLGQLAKDRNLPIQTHISENLNEIKWIEELFPERTGYADIYDHAGLLTSQTVLAHAIHLTEEDKRLVKERGSGVSHCPVSNSSLSSGLAPIRCLLKSRIKVGLGTDVSGGYSVNILDVARQALMVSREVAFMTKNDEDKLSVDEVLYLATMGGAEVCNLHEKIGNFQVGKQWDALHIDLGCLGTRIDVFDWAIPKETDLKLDYLVQKWFFLGDDRNIEQVWVNGREVKKGLEKENEEPEQNGENRGILGRIFG